MSDVRLVDQRFAVVSEDAVARAIDNARQVRVQDMKATRNQREARLSARPKLTLLTYNAQVHEARARAYGADKYARSNFLAKPPPGVDAFEQLGEYLDAALRHVGKVSHAMNVARVTGGDRSAAVGLPDEDGSGGFPPSALPHLAHAMASLAIAVEVGVRAGLLATDPGEPWKQHPEYETVLARRGEAPAAMPQKDDPDAERARIAGTPARTTESAAWEKMFKRHGVGVSPQQWLPGDQWLPEEGPPAPSVSAETSTGAMTLVAGLARQALDSAEVFPTVEAMASEILSQACLPDTTENRDIATAALRVASQDACDEARIWAQAASGPRTAEDVVLALAPKIGEDRARGAVARAIMSGKVALKTEHTWDFDGTGVDLHGPSLKHEILAPVSVVRSVEIDVRGESPRVIGGLAADLCPGPADLAEADAEVLDPPTHLSDPRMLNTIDNVCDEQNVVGLIRSLTAEGRPTTASNIAAASRIMTPERVSRAVARLLASGTLSGDPSTGLKTAEDRASTEAQTGEPSTEVER